MLTAFTVTPAKIHLRRARSLWHSAMATLPGLPRVKSSRGQYKKRLANVRFFIQKSPVIAIAAAFVILLPAVVLLTLSRPLASGSFSLERFNLLEFGNFSTKETATPVDACSNAIPVPLNFYDPSFRSSAEFHNPVPQDVDPPTLNRIFSAFFKIYLFQPSSDIVVNLNSTARGRPTDIRDGLHHSQHALRRYYNDDTLRVLNYSMGYEHLDRVRGSRYIFHLHTQNATHPSRRHAVAVQRTFDGNCFVSVRHYPQTVFDNPVYIILPYSARPRRLQWFLEQFEYLVENNANVRLLVATCKHDDADVAKTHQLVQASDMRDNITVVPVSGDHTKFFSRAIAIREAAAHVPEDHIMFISDVDMFIFPTLFDGCRFNTIRGSQVYFPVFYSLFAGNSRIARDAGYWRDSSLGMSCMYKSDFDAVNAYGDAERRFLGWGGEDKALSRAFDKSPDHQVFRAVEPALRHKWHIKNCEKFTPAYEDCLTVSFQQLGNMATIGKLLLKEDKYDTQGLFKRYVDDDDDGADPADIAEANGEGEVNEELQGRQQKRKEFLETSYKRAQEERMKKRRKMYRDLFRKKHENDPKQSEHSENSTQQHDLKKKNNGTDKEEHASSRSHGNETTAGERVGVLQQRKPVAAS